MNTKYIQQQQFPVHPSKWFLTLLLLLLTIPVAAQDYWNELPLYGGGANTIAASPGGSVFCGNFTGIWRSSATSNGWEHVLGTDDFIGVESLQITKTGNIYAIAEDLFDDDEYDTTFFYISGDNGDNWYRKYSLDPSYEIESTTIGSDGAFYALIASYEPIYFKGILRTQDNGDNWEITSLGDTLEFTTLVAKTDNEIIAAGYHGLHRSLDGGETWFTIEGATDLYGINIIALNNENHFYLGMWNGELYRSIDDGETWVMVDSLTNFGQFHSITFDSTGNVFYAYQEYNLEDKRLIVKGSTGDGGSW
ncbi:MAG: sialidase family protein, partial [bacterium]|nr:sialidase family protein [bacterium]